MLSLALDCGHYFWGRWKLVKVNPEQVGYWGVSLKIGPCPFFSICFPLHKLPPQRKTAFSTHHKSINQRPQGPWMELSGIKSLHPLSCFSKVDETANDTNLRFVTKGCLGFVLILNRKGSLFTFMCIGGWCLSSWICLFPHVCACKYLCVYVET